MVYVEHASGGTSSLTLKSYDQKREAFQGTEQDFILLDEEPPESIYTECMMRTMATGSFAGGMVMMTFTPLMGMTQLVQRLIEVRDDDATGSAWTTSITWDDVPHLSEAEKIEMLAAMPPHQRDARSKGAPQLGAGAVWPVPESEFVVAPFAIPAHWPRAYALDVGWNRSAVVWAAWDREHDIVYLYDEHYVGEAEASQHAAAIRARGAWMSGVIDPGARGRSQVDGRSLIDLYRDLGLRLSPSDNAVETGLHSVWLRLASGRLKVFSSMRNWLSEFRLYRRDEKGRIVKERDHCLHPDTMVITGSGPRRIVELVGTEGVVLTSSGGFARYRNCRKTGEDQPLVKVTFADGRDVHCTPDHLFSTYDGWIPAEHLAGHQVIDAMKILKSDASPWAAASLEAAGHDVQRLREINHAAWHERCVRVEPAGRSDVYCMTVPGVHNFAVEGGLIVSNCMDATRYVIASGLSVARVGRSGGVVEGLL